MGGPGEEAELLLSIRGATLGVGARTLVSGASLDVRRGSCVALVGRNGVGKTTLLRAALGLVRPLEGRVRLGDDSASNLSPRERAARVAWLPQAAGVTEDLAAWEVVAAARFRFREAEAVSRREATAALEGMGAGHLAKRTFPSLSGGERQRVALAALVAQDAPLLLLDEPGNHLDPAAQVDTYRRIGSLRRGGRGVVCVSHDVNLLGELSSGVGGGGGGGPDDDDPEGDDRGGPSDILVFGIVDRRLVHLGALGEPDLALGLSEVFGIPFRFIPPPGGQGGSDADVGRGKRAEVGLYVPDLARAAGAGR